MSTVWVAGYEGEECYIDAVFANEDSARAWLLARHEGVIAELEVGDAQGDSVGFADDARRESIVVHKEGRLSYGEHWWENYYIDEREVQV